LRVDLQTVEEVVLWGVVIVAALGLLMAILIKKIIGKIIALLVAATLVFVGWQQRDKVLDYAQQVSTDACNSVTGTVDQTVTDNTPTFLGVEVSLPDDWCS